GGLVGGRFARRLPAGLFRGFVVIVGITTVTATVLSH
ncbi:sulfite exporter TauE/SafE family protein, partial [Salmonella enterica subsp. enterica serovar Haifa]|nr:sulfite exporter TauE/SafE family protein [Salmonella enterica subsp. enterica serovar Haifa]